MKYQVELSERQIDVINKALDLYGRLHIGQTEAISRAIENKTFNDPEVDHEKIEDFVEELKTIAFPGLHRNAFFGIFSNEAGPEAQIAWDIQQVLRHRVSWDKAGNPSTRDHQTMWTVNYDSPMQSRPDEPLCEIRRTDDDRDST